MRRSRASTTVEALEAMAEHIAFGIILACDALEHIGLDDLLTEENLEVPRILAELDVLRADREAVLGARETGTIPAGVQTRLLDEIAREARLRR